MYPRFMYPKLSLYIDVRTALTVLPEAGVTESAVITSPPGTVQVPRVCQPLFNPPTVFAYRNIVLAPANAGLKLTDTVSDRLLPDPVADDPVPFTTHWLFCTV